MIDQNNSWKNLYRSDISHEISHDSALCPSPVLGKCLFLAVILSVSLAAEHEVSFFIFAGLSSAVTCAYVLLDLAAKSSGIRGTK